MATDGTRGVTSESGREEQWENVLTEAFGGFDADLSQPFSADGTSEPPATQAVAPASSTEPAPTGSPPAPQASATGDDGTTGTPVVDASPVAVPGTTDASPPADDLATAAPFDYTVDGETRTIPGTYRIPGEGLIVPEEHVARFQQMATRSDASERQIKSLYDETQAAKERDATWTRLSAWQVQGPDGKPQVWAGERGLAEMRLAAERGKALVQAVGSIFDDPAQAGRLTMQVQGNDGQIYTIWNQDGVKSLGLQARVSVMEAERNVSGQLSQLRAPPAPSMPNQADAAASAQASIDQIVTSNKIAGLTDSDLSQLRALAPRFIRATTPQERQQYGPLILDASIVDVVKERAALRAEAAKQATTAAANSKFNAGMQNGVKPRPAAAPAKPAAPAPTPERRTKASDWQNILETAVPNVNSLSSWDDAAQAVGQ